MTHHTDLRSYLDALEGVDELQRIHKPVALDLEIGAVSRRAGETGQAAPLFENIPERSRMRVLGAPGGVSSSSGRASCCSRSVRATPRRSWSCKAAPRSSAATGPAARP